MLKEGLGGREALVQRPCSFEGIHRSIEIVDEIVVALTICIQVIEHIKAHRAYEGRFRHRRYSLTTRMSDQVGRLYRQFSSQSLPLLSMTVQTFDGMVQGALDGTLIGVRVPEYEKGRYRTRKGQVAVNVLCVCNPNMQFIFVPSGWEGSAADNRVLRDAVHRPNGLRLPIGAMDADFFSLAYVNTLEDDSSSQ
ncbi:hypothetical protein Sango_0822400 [Sesamum angolense]|uniref:DDE Tnp4 domain-containing protein n=1 Tax=Sesamum angolense TaxID=2727404 RepID=A0AAE2C0H7_9LAMI|nr:hypothetical protein Sango_0822400 [Sesamum angolense]